MDFRGPINNMKNFSFGIVFIDSTEETSFERSVIVEHEHGISEDKASDLTNQLATVVAEFLRSNLKDAEVTIEYPIDHAIWDGIDS